MRDITPQTAATHLLAVFAAGGKLLICGNGGSAADAGHIAAEFVGRYRRRERQALPAISLAACAATITAVGNDFGFEHIFSRQVLALGRPRDCLLAISTSGTSVNVIAAARAARHLRMSVIGFAGDGSCPLAECCDRLATFPGDTAAIQEGYMRFAHEMVGLVEESLP